MTATMEGRLRRSIAVIAALTIVAALALLLKAHSVKSRLPGPVTPSASEGAAPSTRPAR